MRRRTCLVLVLLTTAFGAAPPRKADAPPRKVVVGTAIYGPYGEYPGLERRLEVLGGLVDEMARRAAEQDPGRGLDLAVLPESTVNRTGGTARDRAVPLDGPVRDTFGALARKHRTYILAAVELAEETSDGSICSNAAVLFDRRGEVAGIYRKVHPVAVLGTDDLENGITPGRETPVFDCDFGRLGVQICWDVQFPEGWDALARGGAEIVAWPSASPATAMPAAHAARNRYYVVASTWRDNATVHEPTGLVAARQRGPSGSVLVHQLDLSYALLGWSAPLQNGEAFRRRFGDRAGFHYEPAEDLGLFWSNDPATPIGRMVEGIGLEEIDDQVARNRRLYDAAAAPRAR